MCVRPTPSFMPSPPARGTPSSARRRKMRTDEKITVQTPRKRCVSQRAYRTLLAVPVGACHPITGQPPRGGASSSGGKIQPRIHEGPLCLQRIVAPERGRHFTHITGDRTRTHTTERFVRSVSCCSTVRRNHTIHSQLKHRHKYEDIPDCRALRGSPLPHGIGRCPLTPGILSDRSSRGLRDPRGFHKPRGYRQRAVRRCERLVRGPHLRTRPGPRTG